MLFGGVISLFGSFIGLTDNMGEKNMVNEYALSALRCFFLFACCIMALEASAYFLPEPHTEAFPADLRPLGSSPGIHILESEQKGAHWCKLGLAKSLASDH